MTTTGLGNADTGQILSARLHNFAAGPGTLPESVLVEAREELPVYQNVGASVMEISHRSPAYTAIADEARQLIRELMGLTDDWHILFLQGGASMQFYQVPLNFLSKEGSADYLITGAWAKKAFKEGAFLGKANVVASSDDKNFSYIPHPAQWILDPSAAYLHYTSNNTIFGTQFHTVPDVAVPLVCDASSDFLGYPIDPDRYGLIYAGAQKNVGPSGVTVVLIKDEFLQTRNQPLPTMLDYGTHTSKLFNTPPVYAVYLVGKVLKWLKDLGGIPGIMRINDLKSSRLYERIDRNDFYRGTAALDSRSKMNVTFRLASEDLEKQFVQEAAAAGLLALKGHRSVGGIRASIYNACPLEAVDALVSFMDAFEAKNG